LRGCSGGGMSQSDEPGILKMFVSSDDVCMLVLVSAVVTMPSSLDGGSSLHTHTATCG
jgi:hypothetical protein